MENHSFYLAAYDISSNKRRAKIAKIMESMGARVQGSVFEIWLDDASLQQLIKRCRKVINEKDDSLRLYSICANCRQKITIIGQGKTTTAPDLVIV